MRQLNTDLSRMEVGLVENLVRLHFSMSPSLALAVYFSCWIMARSYGLFTATRLHYAVTKLENLPGEDSCFGHA